MKYLNILFLFLFTSLNVFPQWMPLYTGSSAFYLYKVYAVDGFCIYVVGEDGTVLKTVDAGETWTQNVVSSADIWALYFINRENGFIGCENGEILKTTNGGSTWITQNSGLPGNIFDIYFTDLLNGTAVTYQGKYIKTSNGGETWVMQDAGYPLLLRDISFSGSHGMIVGGGLMPYPSFQEIRLVLATTDSGINWIVRAFPDKPRFRFVSVVNENLVYAADELQIHRSTDMGLSWVTVTSKFIGDMDFIDSLTGYVTSNGNIAKTTDAGITWTTQSWGNIFSIDILNDSIGYAAGGGGLVYRTWNGGEVPVEFTSFIASASGDQINLSWSTASELNNRGFEIERKNDGSWRTIGFVSGKGTTTESNTYTYNDDVSGLQTGQSIYYRLKQTDFNGSYDYSTEVEVTFAHSFSLEQNYPNPFNPITTITYSIPEQKRVTLKIYDLLGREKAALVNEEKSAGQYSIEWNASDYSSGVYFYRLTAGEFTFTKKLLLMK